MRSRSVWPGGWRFFRHEAGRAAGPPPWAYVLLFTLCTLLGDWSGQRYGVVVIWPANGVTLAAFLQLRRADALRTMGACFLINLIGNALRGDQAHMVFVHALINQLEPIFAGLVARRFCGAALDMRRPARLARFALIGVAPTVAATALVGNLALGVRPDQFGVSYETWFTVDSLGMLVVTPTLLLIARSHRFSDEAPVGGVETAALLGLLVAVTTAVFCQSLAPVLFLIMPPLLLIAFRLAPQWSALSVIIVAVLATGFTLNGWGPITLSRLGPQHWMDARVLAGLRMLPVLQMFIAAALLVTLPASTVLSERRRLVARLRARNAAALQARRLAEAAAEAKSRFLSMMSHELRTPLNGVSGFAELLASRPGLDPVAREQVAQIQRSSESLLSLVEDILEVSCGKTSVESRPFALAATAQAALEQARAFVGPKPLSLVFRCDEPLSTARLGDERRLAQVLRALLSNAVKFSPQGVITLTLTGDPAGVRIEVADSGPGIAPELAPRLFETFVQGDASISRAHEGAGIGLALARRLALAMGGEIYARNGDAGGAAFTVELPAALHLAHEEDEAPHGPAAQLDRGPRVLVVDDHPANREVAALMLQALGCETATANDGGEAVESVAAGGFDLVFMDVRMPGMDGLEATRRIRRLEGPKASTPIVAMTADAMPEDVARCLLAGMDAHVAKPITQAKLYAALAAHLGEPSPADDSAQAA